MAQKKSKSKEQLCKVKKEDNNNLLPDVITPQPEMKKFFDDIGMNEKFVAQKIMELCNAKSIKIDKNGEVHESEDNSTAIKAIELWAKITGTLKQEKKQKDKEIHQHIHLSEEKLNELDRKTK